MLLFYLSKMYCNDHGIILTVSILYISALSAERVLVYGFDDGDRVTVSRLHPFCCVAYKDKISVL